MSEPPASPSEPAGPAAGRTPAGDTDTVGTGSVFAIACSVLTAVGIVLGIAVFVVIQLV